MPQVSTRRILTAALFTAALTLAGPARAEAASRAGFPDLWHRLRGLLREGIATLWKEPAAAPGKTGLCTDPKDCNTTQGGTGGAVGPRCAALTEQGACADPDG